jgi:hypothetical protein
MVWFVPAAQDRLSSRSYLVAQSAVFYSFSTTPESMLRRPADDRPACPTLSLLAPLPLINEDHVALLHMVFGTRGVKLGN